MINTPNTYFSLSQKLLSVYESSGKNPNSALNFILNSIDPDTCAIGIELVDSFLFTGDTASFSIDTKNVHAINSLFGTIDSTLVEKLLWIAFLLPEV